MATRRMDEDWRRIRDRIKAIWSDVEFQDSNLKRARGSLQRMVSLIHKKTQEPRPVIRRKIMAAM